MSDLARAEGFLAALQDHVSERREPWRGGVAYLNPSIPKVWDANVLRVDDYSLSAEEIAVEADLIMAAAGCLHRRVWFPDPAAAAKVEEGFTELGWETDVHVIMGHHREPDRMVDTSDVQEVGNATWPSRIEQLREHPGMDEETCRQMRVLHDMLMDAGRGRDFAIMDGDRAVSFSLLFSDGKTGQVEDVATLEAYRKKGLSRSVVTKALAVSRAEHDFTFLVADDRGWPKQFYAKLGFDEIGHRYYFLKQPPK